MEEKIISAIKKSPDYSDKFTSLVNQFRESIYRKLGIWLRHDRDMNYSSSQKLELYLDDQYMFLTNNLSESTVKIIYWISSKGNYFTFMCFLKNKNNHWELSGINNKSSKMQKYVAEISKLLEKNGYEVIIGDILDTEIEGFFTEMDEAPATLFQILFSEVY